MLTMKLRICQKPRPLPLRTTFIHCHEERCPLGDPVAAVQPNPSTLTPAESSEEDNGTEDSAGSGTRILAGHDNENGLDSMKLQQRQEADVDLEMIDFQPESASLFPPHSGRSTCTHSSDVSMSSPIPSRLINQTLNVDSGRTATPIYSHFTSNMNVDVMMRDNNNSSSAQSSLRNFDTPSAATPHCRELWHNRRLPSPVSEGEKSPDPPQTSDAKPLENPVGPLGYGGLETSKPTTSYPVFGHDAQHREHNRLGSDTKHSCDAHSHPNTRTRTNRMKMGIAMGYRADCDKCQRRVPGHYSHIIRS